MKRVLFLLVAVFTLLTTQTSVAQFDSHRLTFGVVSTQLFSQDQDHKMSDIKNPLGMGAVLGYQFDKAGAVGLTVQYADGTLEQGGGKEKDVRTSLSMFVYPLSLQTIRPYFSAGMVYTRRTTSFDSGLDQSKDLWHARFGVGAEYSLFRMVTMTVDLGAYNDGMRFVAGGGTLGFRFTAM
ncbi:MAG TPA: outer membrane beta-barrel protein [Bacteroidota bacterium]|nr:outer membrane beta-barrel protein [Bacteroidota bacterium]